MPTPTLIKSICLLSVLLIPFFIQGSYKKINIKSRIINYLLFHPDKRINEIPSDFNLKYEEVSINTENNNTLHGWYIPVEKQTNKNIIYLHGSKGNIGLYLGGIEQLHKSGANILIVDYQGFGKSTGKPSVQNTIDDGIAMYDYLINEKNVKPEDISLFGYSYGGAIAIELALKHKVNAVLVESTFLSLNKIATAKYTRLVSPFVSKNLLDCENNIKKVNVPIIVAYASDDQIVPVTNSKDLYDNANEPKYLFEIKDAQHHNIFEFVTPEYLELIKKVLV